MIIAQAFYDIAQAHEIFLLACAIVFKACVFVFIACVIAFVACAIAFIACAIVFMACVFVFAACAIVFMACAIVFIACAIVFMACVFVFKACVSRPVGTGRQAMDDSMHQRSSPMCQNGGRTGAVLASLAGCEFFFIIHPGVSLRSPPGYKLSSRWDEGRAGHRLGSESRKV